MYIIPLYHKGPLILLNDFDWKTNFPEIMSFVHSYNTSKPSTYIWKSMNSTREYYFSFSCSLFTNSRKFGCTLWIRGTSTYI